jgi:nicotinate-nucleotide adenylyltransferase
LSKIGVFGGTFNPIHYGHLRAAEEVREMLGFERVLFVPSGNPPLKTGDLADALKRYEMVRLATAGNRSFDVLDLESVNPAKSYTVETLEVLVNRYSGSELYFMLGMDAFLDIPIWWMPEKLVTMVNFAVISRPGRKFEDLFSSPYLDVGRGDLKALDDSGGEFKILRLKSLKEAALVKITPIDISSSDIRRRMRAGQSVKYLLPESVESFIISNKLYSPVT